ncbi:FUSC family protein [Actinacidiphila bryophytorum]|uniref:FUSC family protein n=1 Tax=Actinacidiphila bryophytorum TaxID=1436133 RepID=UPI002176CDC8|nr:FUSC family protein [Actinacidiphila bryophytorum]UWE08009.1 FUSC family protein [Actinacidiphila bryophytorum]
MGQAVLDRLRLLDPGRVRLRTALRTVLAALAALLATAALCSAADLPGGIVVIATVVAVMVSRTLHETSLAHRLSALLYVPAIGLLAGYVGRFMLHHTWWGSAMYVAAVGASRYLLRFGGTVRRLGRLALTPLIAVMVVPIPPSAAEAAGPAWGAVAAAVAVCCVLLSQTALPAHPTHEAATAARDLIRASLRARTFPPGTPIASRRGTAFPPGARGLALLPGARRWRGGLLPGAAGVGGDFAPGAAEGPDADFSGTRGRPGLLPGAWGLALLPGARKWRGGLLPGAAGVGGDFAPGAAGRPEGSIPGAPGAVRAPRVRPGAAGARRALHRAALTVEDRLDAALLPPSAPLAALSTAVLRAEVLASASLDLPGQVPGAGDAGASPGPGSAAAGVVAGQVFAAADGGGSVKAQARTDGSAVEQPAAHAGGSASATAVEQAPADAGGGAAGSATAEVSASGGGDALDLALGEVEAAAAAVRRIPARARPAPEPKRAAARKGGVQPHTRLSVQLTAAMAVAFAVGHLLFPHRWTWTVITAFVVCSAARARGDVVHRSGLRVAGAFTGAVTGTLVAHVVAGTAPAAVAVIFCYLFLGLWLRDVSYALWAFCVTSLLAVLYSLNGEHGTAALLLQRPEGILAGSACGILAAYFVLPLRTETVMRGRAARALQVLQDLLTAAREPHAEPAALRRLARSLDRASRDLGDAAASARAHRTLFGRGAPHAADWADTLAVCVGRRGRWPRRPRGTWPRPARTWCWRPATSARCGAAWAAALTPSRPGRPRRRPPRTCTA